MKSVNSLISGQISSFEDALRAVEEHPETLTYIPHHFMNDDVVYAAVIQRSSLFSTLEIEQFTQTLIERLLTNKPYLLEHIPDELLTKDVFLTQVNKDGLWLEYVPNEFRDLEVCLAAINQNILSHKFVPTEIQSKEYLDRLIYVDSNLIGDVAVENRNPDVVLELISKGNDVLQYVPDVERTKEMSLKSIQNNILNCRWLMVEVYEDPQVFEFICNHPYFDEPEKYDPNFSESGVYHPYIIRQKLADYLINKDVIKHFKHIPPQYITLEHCKFAIKTKPSMIRLCPKNLRVKFNLWEEALQLDSTLLSSVPKLERTGAIEVLMKNYQALSKGKTLFDMIISKKENQ